jgi:O-antigen/teichoic acid export membrane protein
MRENLREKAIRGGIANTVGRVAGILLRIVSIVTLGRLLSPRDYGLFGMATTVTSVLTMLSGFGLLQAAIQHETMTEGQASTLFWVNVLMGGLLTAVTFAIAPIVSAFYHEPRLLLISNIVALGFLVTGVGVQHNALLQRQMRFGARALIDIFAMLFATCLAVGLALKGAGYWALVSTAVSLPLATTIGAWLATGWIPEQPRRGTGIRSMLRFGSTMTLNGLVAYVEDNFGKVLLGRYWGAEAIGIYDRAYRLIMFPTENINGPVGEVAFAALSRARNNPEQLRAYFIKTYSLVVSVTVPITIFSALFAGEIIHLALGSQWAGATEIFRLLAPTILVCAIANPLGWLMSALGMVQRGLNIGLVSAPIMIGGAIIGMPFGARGIAIGYSAAMVLKIIPLAIWAVHGTAVRLRDIFSALRSPLLSSLVAVAFVAVAHLVYSPMLSVPLCLVVDVAVFGTAYLATTWLVTDQRSFYVELLRTIRSAPSW